MLGVRVVGLPSRSARERAVAGRRVCEREGGSNSVVESQPSKLLVAGSIPVSRSKKVPGSTFRVPGSHFRTFGERVNQNHCERTRNMEQGTWNLNDADVAQLAERVLGKDEVTGSIPVIGSSLGETARLAGARGQ